MKVHFIGINGSGAAGVAIVAKKSGFDVSGCDRSARTPYSAQVEECGIAVANDHDKKHVDDTDIVAVSAALLEQKNVVDEVEYARASGKLMKWQEFLGKYILSSKRLIAICGTHGKTTTSSMVAHMLEFAGLDPTAFIGAIVPDWNSSARHGAGEWAVLEADEYANNFAPYRPEIAILNNLEMEHPEYFRDWNHYKKTFVDFLSNAKCVIYNMDDSGISEIIDLLAAEKIPFSEKDFPNWEMNLIGRHNRANAMAAITLARKIGITDSVAKNAIASFRGANHRLEKIFDDDSLIIYDDYAHHHSQVLSTISAVKEAHPGYKIIAVYEPHQISRYVQNTQATLNALALADSAVIVDFWRGREAHLAVPDVASDIAKFEIENVGFIPDFDKVVDFVTSKISPKTVVVVMGAGASHKISERLLGTRD
jgi:UDP-N-acetylmuramate--alanine ligase